MSKLNVQNMPKDPAFLRCFKAAPGHVLVYSDINSLEPHVMAHFTQDPGLMSLYGPGAEPNDVYLFVGAQIDKWKDSILEHYNPFHPTTESIAAAKKHCKSERQEIKAPYLGWLYGLGAGTMSTGTGIPYEECKRILEDINNTFYRVPKFNKRLRKQWESNGGYAVTQWVYDKELDKQIPIVTDGSPGWILNGRGRPLAVAPDKVKDLGNRFVQSTGHDVLMQMLVYINELRQERQVPMRPYNVDIHDATIWQVPENYAQQAADIIRESYVRLNDALRWTVSIEGDVAIGNNLGEFLE